MLAKMLHCMYSKRRRKRMSKLNYEIADRYANELGDINDKFDKLERGRIYEFTRSKMDGSLEKNMKQLRMMI